ncbi:MFS transporter [Edaphobacillus lindanitolerans]|uniref:Predicted arabinose efflux permease, MFS family n=1 Tax=Edaphobacillus lindanitolerans TaxID=550447 RepID=A0A1U7PM96_9BACI|nr:MFS transporter [Edaphobacillus lindanitolerans]SIT83779.1 Predicted arabinose efflux permease, MFS family [Edaphobacillus lindanitolerans]
MQVFVYLIVFFSFFDLFSQLPVMSPHALALGATPFVTGLVVGIYSFANTVGNVISGFVTDRKGPFIVLISGLALSSVALFLYAFATDPEALLTVRVLHGFMEGLIVPAAFTFIANRAEGSKRGRKVALSGAFVGLAAIAGPATGGILASTHGAPIIMTLNGCIMMILAVTAFFLLRTGPSHRKTPGKTADTRYPVRKLFGNKGVMRAFAGAFFLMFSQGVLALVLPLKVEALGYDTKTSGMLLSIFGLVAILIFVLPTNRLFDRLRPMSTLAFGITVMGISMLFLSVSSGMLPLYVSMMLYGSGFAFLFPSINSLLIDSTEAEYRGKAYGYFYAFFSIGVVAGSGLIGWLGIGFKGAFTLTGALMLAVALYIVTGLSSVRKTGRTSENRV